MFSSSVQREFTAPYHLGRPAVEDLVGRSGVSGQGPYLTLYLGRRDGRVASAWYETYSCPNAIACGSWVCRWAEGSAPEMLLRLTAEDLTTVLGGLPLGKEHCAALAVGALKDALSRWDVGAAEGGRG